MSQILFWNHQNINASDYQHWRAVVLMPNGAIREFDDSDLLDSRSQTRLEPRALAGKPTVYSTFPLPGSSEVWPDTTTHGFRLVYPDGSQDIYGLAEHLAGSGGGESLAFLNRRIDAVGNAYDICYESALVNSTSVGRIKKIRDPDGRIVHFYYEAANDQDSLFEVRDPYNRRAVQLSSGQVGTVPGQYTSITDSAGMQSRFIYDTDPAYQGWVKELQTPYGTNAFRHYEAGNQQDNYGMDQGNLGGHNRINRYLYIKVLPASAGDFSLKESGEFLGV